MASQSVTNVTQGKKTEKEKRKRQVKLISNQRHRSDVCARKTALQRRIRKKKERWQIKNEGVDRRSTDIKFPSAPLPASGRSMSSVSRIRVVSDFGWYLVYRYAYSMQCSILHAKSDPSRLDVEPRRGIKEISEWNSRMRSVLQVEPNGAVPRTSP